ncbi:hypothetical protein BG005_011051 [Podila minutissima]|nr:hypothetical protein BG005_011051 [Podila minutissima]
MGATQQSIANRLMGSLQMLFLFMLPILALAQQQNPNDRQPDVLEDLLGDGRLIALTWQRIVAGLVLLLIGIILTFRGYRHYRFTMFLAGFIAGCVIAYSILTNVEPTQGWEYRQIIYVFSCIGAGLVIGTICWLLHRYTVWVLGALAGLILALYILAWRNQGLIHSKGGRIGLLVGCSVVGLLLALALGRRILIPASALIGAYVTVIGLDLFARTGFAESIKKFFTTDDTVNYRLTTNLYIMLGVVGGLLILGLLYQSLSWNHRQKALIAQGRSLHNYDNDWSCFRGKQTTVRPDPTYPDGSYREPTMATGHDATTGYDANTGHGYNTGATTTDDLNTGTTTTYTEKKKKWKNPFKKEKPATTTTPTTVAEYPDNRVSFSSNTALNQ